MWHGQDARGVKNRAGRFLPGQGEQDGCHQVGMLDVIQDEQRISLIGQVATKVLRTSPFFLGTRWIVTRWQIARGERQFREVMLPVEEIFACGKHPEDATRKAILVAVGQFYGQFRLAHTSHAGYSHHPPAYWVLFVCCIKELGFQPLEFAGTLLEEGIMEKGEVAIRSLVNSRTSAFGAECGGTFRLAGKDTVATR
jgi:hypothetical protein